MQNSQETTPEPSPVEATVPDADPKESPLEPITSNVVEAIDSRADWFSCKTADIVAKLGLPSWLEPIVSGVVFFLFLAGLAFLIFFIVRPFVLRILTSLIRKTAAKWDDSLVEFGVARWTSHFLSALCINVIVLGFSSNLSGGKFLTMLGQLYLVFSGMLAVNALLNSAKRIFVQTKDTHKLPATSLVQVLKLLCFLVALILVISTLTNRSPLAFLGGLGVFTSVLLLVFKDAILGFVAGIQLTSNDMIKEGDWIEMKSHGADGDVQEVGLTTVKVMNFDKTITTIPTYTLISESFKNWRSMPQSGGRRIKRSIYIDLKTIQLCDDEMFKRYRKIQLISDYLEERAAEIHEWNSKEGFDPSRSIVNGRNLTNIGTFRAYIEAYLRSHPKIHQEKMTLIVRQLASGPHGVPIEIYCFSNVVGWADYEVIQSDIFDHIFAVAKEFDLEIFQHPTELSFSS